MDLFCTMVCLFLLVEPNLRFRLSCFLMKSDSDLGFEAVDCVVVAALVFSSVQLGGCCCGNALLPKELQRL